MKAVIFAAGDGKRMRPLTEDIPKPMLRVSGKPILEHIFDRLPQSVDEVVLVVGYRADQIRSHFGSRFKRFKVLYVYQDKPTGTAHGLLLCRPFLSNEKFLSMYADDLHGRADLEALIEHPLAVLVKEVKNPERFGVVTLGEDGNVLKIVEKPEKPAGNLVSSGPAVLDQRIFDIDPPQHRSGEYFLADMIGKLVKLHPVAGVPQSFWFAIGYPEDILRLEREFGSIQE